MCALETFALVNDGQCTTGKCTWWKCSDDPESAIPHVAEIVPPTMLAQIPLVPLKSNVSLAVPGSGDTGCSHLLPITRQRFKF